MTLDREICRNCIHFRPERGVKLDEQSPAALVLSTLRIGTGGSIPPEYGKCVARGKLAPQPGVFSPQSCQVEDEVGNKLFAPKASD